LLLGAGWDTSYQNIRQNELHTRISSFIEIDHEQLINEKRKIMSDSKSQAHKLIGHDLRDTTGLVEKLKKDKVNMRLPTLIVTEAVLSYMEP
jgi:O-methyltransferase involved in polyketide biosynthesis